MRDCIVKCGTFLGVSPMVQCAKSVAMNIDDEDAIDTWRRQNGLVSTISLIKNCSMNV